MEITSIVRNCKYALETSGVFAALQVLNANTPYRFTGIYRFEDGWVKSIWLYDRLAPNVTFGSDVRWDDSYCRLTSHNGDLCEITDAGMDRRLVDHAARDRVRSYIAVLLKKADGSHFGTLCHYDLAPQQTPPDALATLQAARTVIESAVASPSATAL